MDDGLIAVHLHDKSTRVADNLETAEQQRRAVKIPPVLVRSGLKLTSLIPPQAMEQINQQMTEKGISVDFSNPKPEDIDGLVQSWRSASTRRTATRCACTPPDRSGQGVQLLYCPNKEERCERRRD